jgi:transposase-like protein
MRRGREFWERALAEVAAGERLVDVARRHRVQPRTLSWWRWKLKSEGQRDPLLLPVVVASDDSGVVEVRVGDLIMRVACGTDVTYVASLVAALRG